MEAPRATAVCRPIHAGFLLWIAALWLVSVGAGCTTIVPASPPSAPLIAPTGFSHAEFDRVLAHFVDEKGRVDYPGLAADRVDLDGYYAKLAAVSPDSHPELFPDDRARLAYWINAYNATAIETVLHYYPIDSVHDVGPAALFFLPRITGFFLLQRIELGGRKTSLYALENSVMRRRFAEPRIHFALNCASIGCPRLPRQAFRAKDLDAQLDRETRFFVSESRNVDIDPANGRITLSSILDWYDGDFLDALPKEGRQDLVGFIEPYLTDEQRSALARCGDCRVEFVPYDWGLNAQVPRALSD
ncbi:MAG: DUF547 domain-containing protein [Myxococcales bacterium]|nr:DUF547 domain-containing protein [Myxococcales bacterium]